MKVMITAFALSKACDGYMKNIEDQLQKPEKIIKTTGFLWWRKTEESFFTRTVEQAKSSAKRVPEYNRAVTFSAIAKYKAPQTMLDVSSDEITYIATWLPEFVSERI